jgi:hypothetical protein
MAKILAGLQQYTPEFNEDPPHWDSKVIGQVPWPEIVPIYGTLSVKTKALIPLAVAQVVYHYYKSRKGLSNLNDVFKSPLWVSHQDLLGELYKALRGGDTGQPSKLKNIYRDKITDQYCWTKETNENTKLMMEQMAHMQKEMSETKNRVTDLEKGLKNRYIPAGINSVQPEKSRTTGSIDASDAASAELYNKDGESVVGTNVELLPPHRAFDSASAKLCTDDGEPVLDSNVQLHPPPRPFEIQDGISVEDAWHGWHGNASTCPWKEISKKSPLLPQTQENRRRTLQLLNKISILMNFIQGGVSDADVRKNISHAWNLCKRSAAAHFVEQGILEWPLDGSIRTAYMKYLKLRKQQPTICNGHQVVNFDAPKQHQTTIENYFMPSGHMADMDDVIDIKDNEHDNDGTGVDSSGSSDELTISSATRANPAEKCFVCPKCPEEVGRKRDLVVYRTSKTLWQHWDAHHRDDTKPPLWTLFLVSGMKLERSRTAPWLRVPNAMSCHSEDFEMKNMREQILKGNRVLENGTYVELQPSVVERNQGARWFAVIRDSRVMSGQLLMNYCETNCQALQHGEIARVYVESILRVGPGPHIPFSDVPTSTPKSSSERPKLQSASRHTGNGRKQECDTDCSPLKRQRDSGLKPTPPKEQRVGTAPADNSARKRAQSSLIQSPLHSATTPSQHEKEMQTQHDKEMQSIQTVIAKSTSNDAEALALFQTASLRLTTAGWRRCKTMENGFQTQNIQHPNFKVIETPRDGDCMYHCLLRVLRAAGVRPAPETPQELRNEIATFVNDQVPPQGIEKGRYGGIYTDGTYLPLEENLASKYGGEATLAVFVQMYDITIHCHAPECRNTIEAFQSSSRDAQEYHMLQTYSWNTWKKVETRDPKSKIVITTTYEHDYAGDHWQLLEPTKSTRRGKMLQFDDCPPSAASTASTAQKSSQPTNDVVPLRLRLGNAVSIRLATPCAATEVDCPPQLSGEPSVPKPRQPGTQILPATKLDFKAEQSMDEPNTTVHAPKAILLRGNEVGPSETKFMDRTDVQLMLRAVKIHPFMCNPKLNPKNVVDELQVIEVHSNTFFVYNFENHFDRVYPSHVRKILHAFPVLNEDNRSFFLALGIGIGMDPFMLQCLFRIEAERIMTECKTLVQSIRNMVTPGRYVDFEILRWCWPPDFDQFSVMVMDKEKNGKSGTFNVKLFQKIAASEQQKMVILMHTNDHYQLLHHRTGNDSELRKRATTVQVEITDRRCPSMSTLSQFKLFQNESVFLAAGLEGTEPPEEELEAIWKQTVNDHGLEFEPVTEAWTDFPQWAKHLAKSKRSKDNMKDGSMLSSSWKLLRTKLLLAFEATSHNGQEDRSLARTPCTFVDAGSESGRGLYHMIGDKRITHVAGVEYQLAWFKLSKKIFFRVRNEFECRGFRMPEVTLIHSCMVAQEPVMKWLYSIASIMWMNNFVYDKYDYFNSRTREAPNYMGKKLLTTKKLTPNAAYNFSLNFEDTTVIAVHYPEAFLERWNYTTCEQLQVSCTWSQPSTKEKVTILRHTQHLKITNNFILPSPTMAASNRWDSWTQQWSEIASARSQSPGPSSTDAHGHSISWRHFSTLTHRNWVTSDIIYAYMLLLRRQFPELSFDRYTDQSTKTKKQVQRQFLKDINVFFFNLDDVHWISAKLEKSKKRILMYDSFLEPNETQFEQIEQIANILEVEGTFERIHVKVPHQTNCTDCGVTTCLFLLCMACDIDDEFLYDSPTVMRQFRLTIFDDILNQKVTVLKKRND